MSKKGIYKILFIQTGEIYEIYAKSIYQSDMYGFIEVEEYIFDQNSQIVKRQAIGKIVTVPQALAFPISPQSIRVSSYNKPVQMVIYGNT